MLAKMETLLIHLTYKSKFKPLKNLGSKQLCVRQLLFENRELIFPFHNGTRDLIFPFHNGTHDLKCQIRFGPLQPRVFM